MICQLVASQLSRSHFLFVLLLSLGAMMASSAMHAQSPPSNGMVDIEGLKRLEMAHRDRAANAHLLSTEPPPAPLFSELRQAPPILTQEESELINRSFASREFQNLNGPVKGAIIAGVLVVAWWILRALLRRAKAASRIVVAAAHSAAPTARNAATRVGKTAVGGAKSFFAETITCPSCAELIKAEAKICRFCHQVVGTR